MKRKLRDGQRMRPTLALSMIVKNGEETLPRCLASVEGVVDEIVIADTGSTDRSVEVALQYGAKVIHIPWENDFAKARNLSLAPLRSDWVLSLDDDELLDSDARSLIPPHLSAKHVMAYTVPIRNYVLDPASRLWDQDSKQNVSPPPFAAGFPAYVEHTNARLFRRHPDLYFEGCVHETITYGVQRLGMRIEEARFVIHHLGFADDASTQTKKAFYYRELGREKVRAMPDSAMAHFELGIEESQHFHNYETSAHLFERAAEIDPRLGVAWFFLGRSLSQLGKHREALAALERATETDGNKVKVFETQGDIHYACGELEEARRCYQQVIAIPGGATPEIESKLGLTEVRIGRTADGLGRLRKALDQNRASTGLYDRLITACVWLGNLQAAAETAEEKLCQLDPRPEFFLRAASIRAQLKDWSRVEALLRKGLEEFPKEDKLRRAAAEMKLA